MSRGSSVSPVRNDASLWPDPASLAHKRQLETTTTVWRAHAFVQFSTFVERGFVGRRNKIEIEVSPFLWLSLSIYVEAQSLSSLCGHKIKRLVVSRRLEFTCFHQSRWEADPM